VGAARRILRRLHRYRGRVDEDEKFGRVGDGDSEEGAGRLPRALREPRDAAAASIAGQVTLHEHRADAFARLFEAVHEGVYIGLLGPRQTATLAANPHLKAMFRYHGDIAAGGGRP